MLQLYARYGIEKDDNYLFISVNKYYVFYFLKGIRGKLNFMILYKS